MNNQKFATLDSQMTNDMYFLVFNETYMIGRGDAVEFAKRLVQAKQIILGIEGFNYDGKNITPDMDCIVDFIEAPNEDTVVGALNAILSLKINFVEFTLK